MKLPGSKSLSNRILLLAALAEGTTVVKNLLDSDDIRYMAGALKALGIKLEENWEEGVMVVHGCGGRFPVEVRGCFQCTWGPTGNGLWGT